MGSTVHAVNHRFHRWLTAAITYERDWRLANTENFDFYDGVQWSPAEEAILSSRGQQASVLNMIRPTVDLLLSMEAERRLDFQIVPREPADDVVAKLLTELLKQVFDNCDCNYWLAQAFRDAVIGGRGWVETTVRKDETGANQVYVEHVPWELVYADPFHRRIDGSDMRYIIRCKWVDRDILAEKYPTKAQDIDSTFKDDYDGVEDWAQAASTDRGIDKGYYDSRNNRVWVAECWYRDAKGKARYCVWSDNIFLDGSPDNDGANESPYGDVVIPLCPVYSFRNRKGEPQGLVQLVKGLQQALNKQNSKYVWSTASNRLMIEDGAVDDLEQAREEWNRPDGLVKVSAGALSSGKIKSEDSLREASLILQYMQFVVGMIQRTSGINDAIMGIGGPNERSAQQQSARISQGTYMQTTLFENLFQARKRVSQAVLRLVGKFYTGRQVARVVGNDGMVEYYEFAAGNGQNVNPGSKPLLNVGDILRYDVILKPVPPFTTTRQNALQVFGEVAKSGVIPPQIVGEVMLEMSDLPNKRDLLYRMQKLQAAQQAAAQAQAQAEATGAAPAVQ